MRIRPLANDMNPCRESSNSPGDRLDKDRQGMRRRRMRGTGHGVAQASHVSHKLPPAGRDGPSRQVQQRVEPVQGDEWGNLRCMERKKQKTVSRRHREISEEDGTTSGHDSRGLRCAKSARSAASRCTRTASAASAASPTLPQPTPPHPPRRRPLPP